MKTTADETLHNLINSLDSDLLTEAVPIEEVEAELRAAGCDPAELVARCKPKIEALLAARREAWRKEARERLARRGALSEAAVPCPGSSCEDDSCEQHNACRGCGCAISDGRNLCGALECGLSELPCIEEAGL